MPEILDRPRLGISRCLLGEVVRYDGQIQPFAPLAGLQQEVEFLGLCPEVEAGLPTPREPIQLIQAGPDQPALVQGKITGLDQTQGLHDFSQAYWAAGPKPDLLLLKSRSPSCGLFDTKIYAQRGQTQPSHKGAGIFARQAMAHLGPWVSDEEQLLDPRGRDWFLLLLYMSFSWRQVQEGKLPASTLKVYDPVLLAYAPPFSWEGMGRPGWGASWSRLLEPPPLAGQLASLAALGASDQAKTSLALGQATWGMALAGLGQSLYPARLEPWVMQKATFPT